MYEDEYKKELIQLTEDFLYYAREKYKNGEITKLEYENLVYNKVSFLNDISFKRKDSNIQVKEIFLTT